MRGILRFNPFSRQSAENPGVGAVNIGDTFYKPGQRGKIWTVVRIFRPTSNSITHVVLERGGENPETYVISMGSLMNPHMFRRDRRDAEGVNVTGRKRRWTDHVRPHGTDSGGAAPADGAEGSDEADGESGRQDPPVLGQGG